MKLSRILGSLLSIGAMALLAACGGGGGGGGTTPPVTNPGGGSTPTPAPTASATPTPAPTATPGASLTVSSTVYKAYDGTSWGTDNWQTNGATSSDVGDGDTSSGGMGSNAVDGISCSLPNGEASGTYYHVHSFVGIYVNGTAYALPDAIGMENPDSNEPILNFTCAYTIHTHSAAGIVHVEDPTQAANAAAPAQYNLQSLFDIWGQSLNSLTIAGASGPLSIFVGTPSTKTANNADLVTSYSLYTGSPTSLLLSHHQAIWLIYGTPPAAGVPQIEFDIQT